MRRRNNVKAMAFAAATAALFVSACGTQGGNQAGGGAGASQAQITGAGSTFVYPVLSAWAAD
jgi:ABC-type phosphate transport system substrate-binding protein